MAFIASKAPTTESTADPSGNGSLGELRLVNDATTGELKRIWRYNGSSWVLRVDTTAPVINSVQQPTRPAAASLSENTLYVHLDTGEVDIVTGGTWVENVGRGGIQFGPPANMPNPTVVNPGSLFYVSEQATVSVPLGLYVVIGGAWVGVSSAGAPQTKLITLDLPGTLTLNQTSRPFRPPTGGVIQSVHVDVENAATDSPTGQPVIVDLEVNDGTVFTDQSQRPTVPVDAAVGAAAVPTSPNFTAFSKIVAKVEQLGTAPVALPSVISRDVPSGGTGAISSLSVSRHPSAQVGDMQIEVFYTASDARTWTAPGTGNWLAWGNTTVASSVGKMWTFYRLDDGSAGPWTFTLDAAQTSGARQRLLVRNVHQTTPADTSATGKAQFNNTFDTNITPTSQTTTLANVLEILVARTSASVTVNPGPVDAGYTISSSFSPTTAGSFHVAWIERPTIGTYTGPTSTTSASVTAAIHRIAVVGAGGGGATRVGAKARAYVRYTETS